MVLYNYINCTSKAGWKNGSLVPMLSFPMANFAILPDTPHPKDISTCQQYNCLSICISPTHFKASNISFPNI